MGDEPVVGSSPSPSDAHAADDVSTQHTTGHQGDSHPQQPLPPGFPICHSPRAQHAAAGAFVDPGVYSPTIFGTYLPGQDMMCPYPGQVSQSFDAPSETPDAVAGLGTRSITPQRSTHSPGPSSLACALKCVPPPGWPPPPVCSC
jgi:hypothetical protein